MDNKRLDEAVEVAGRILADHALDGDGPNEKALRIALLAGMKVLLGEPVAWAHPLDVDGLADADMEIGNVVRLFPVDRGYAPRVALYAPSLGEGGYE